MTSNQGGAPNNIAGALTFPSRSDQTLVSVPVQPRQPRNLQGLLRFAMEATKSEDAPGNSQLGPMDEERRKFLEQALKSITVDIAEVLRQSIKILSDTEKIHSIQKDQELPEDVKSAFENLEVHIDGIDIANDFHKLGGFSILPVCYGCENDQVRALASNILAESCQNNPYCQARALECGLLSVLLKLIETETGSALSKCIYALSCATRGFEPSSRALVAQGGCLALVNLLPAAAHNVRTKVAFLVKYLAQNYTEAKEQFVKHELVRTILELIKQGRDSSTEHLLGTLVTLAEDLDPKVAEQLADPRLDAKNILERHLTDPELETDTYIEEKEYCSQLVRVLERLQNAAQDDVADR